MASLSVLDRTKLLRRGVHLQLLTLSWNVIEGIVAVAAGVVAGSVALVGFGIDSFVELASAAIVGWRLLVESQGRSPEQAEQIERRVARVAGRLLVFLAAYIVLDAGRRLLGYGKPAEESVVGIVLTALSLAVMPGLGWAKLKAARLLNSGALRADAFETFTCAWLSLTTLVGLTLNAMLGWWWADPLAALLLVPLIVREGLEAFKHQSCGECRRDEEADGLANR